jgi:hypothetical protein
MFRRPHNVMARIIAQPCSPMEIHDARAIGRTISFDRSARHCGSRRWCPARLPMPPRRARGRSAIENEPPPKLIVDPPLAAALTQGIVWIQYRVENVHIVPVFGMGALNVSPRVGHLHIHFDDLPWFWADPSGVNTIDLAEYHPASTRCAST